MVYAEFDPIPESFARGSSKPYPVPSSSSCPADHFAFIETPDLFFPPVIEFLDSRR